MNYDNLTGVDYAYDDVSRLTGLDIDMAGASGDVDYGFQYTALSQMESQSVSNAGYQWPMPTVGDIDAYLANGLNQYASFDGTALTYDANGNLTRDPESGRTFGERPVNPPLRPGAEAS